MGRIELLIDIDGPANLVGAFFIPQRMAYWYGREMDSVFEVQRGADEFQTGLKVRILGRLAKREVSLVAVVTAYERGRLLEWRFRDGYGVAGLQRWEIEQRANCSRVRLYDEYEMPGRIGKFWDRVFMRRAVQARDRRDLGRLKRLVERTG